MKNGQSGASAPSKEPCYGDGHVFLRWKDYDRRILYVDILYVWSSGSYNAYCLIDGTCVTTTYYLFAGGISIMGGIVSLVVVAWVKR